jgi:hypothetical protein
MLLAKFKSRFEIFLKLLVISVNYRWERQYDRIWVFFLMPLKQQ